MGRRMKRIVRDYGLNKKLCPNIGLNLDDYIPDMVEMLDRYPASKEETKAYKGIIFGKSWVYYDDFREGLAERCSIREDTKGKLDEFLLEILLNVVLGENELLAMGPRNKKSPHIRKDMMYHEDALLTKIESYETQQGLSRLCLENIDFLENVRNYPDNFKKPPLDLLRAIKIRVYSNMIVSTAALGEYVDGYADSMLYCLNDHIAALNPDALKRRNIDVLADIICVTGNTLRDAGQPETAGRFKLKYNRLLEKKKLLRLMGKV